MKLKSTMHHYRVNCTDMTCDIDTFSPVEVGDVLHLNRTLVKVVAKTPETDGSQTLKVKDVHTVIIRRASPFARRRETSGLAPADFKKG